MEENTDFAAKKIAAFQPSPAKAVREPKRLLKNLKVRSV